MTAKKPPLWFRCLLFLPLLAQAQQGLFELQSITVKPVLENRNQVKVLFGFNRLPDQYPFFLVPKPPVLTIDFYDARLAKNLVFQPLKMIPVGDISISQKEIEAQKSVVRVEINLLSATVKYLVEPKENRVELVVTDTGASADKRSVRLVDNLKKSREQGRNLLTSLLVQQIKDSVQIFLSMSGPAKACPVYTLSDPDRLVVDLYDVDAGDTLTKKVDFSPIRDVTIKRSDAEGTLLTNVIFHLSKRADYQVRFQEKQMIILLPRDNFLQAKKKWLLLTGGALLIGGGIGIAVSGEEGSPGPSSSPPPSQNGDLGRPPDFPQ